MRCQGVWSSPGGKGVHQQEEMNCWYKRSDDKKWELWNSMIRNTNIYALLYGILINCYQQQENGWRIVLAVGANSLFGSGSGSSRNRTVGTGLTTWTTRTVGNGPVVPLTTGHFKITISVRIKYSSSDPTMTWSICKLCSFCRSFTSLCEICDPAHICWVAIENLQILLKIWSYFTVIQQILVRSQIQMRQREELLKLNNVRIDSVMRCWDPSDLIEAKAAGTV